MLETISAQLTVTLRHLICHLEPVNFRACSRFKDMDPKSRRQASIQSQIVCLQQRHHSLLHQGPTSNPVSGATTIAGHHNPRGDVLLVTAEVSLQKPTGQLQTCHAVIDSGSQVNLISRRMADLLSLKEMSSPT